MAGSAAGSPWRHWGTARSTNTARRRGNRAAPPPSPAGKKDARGPAATARSSLNFVPVAGEPGERRERARGRPGPELLRKGTGSSAGAPRASARLAARPNPLWYSPYRDVARGPRLPAAPVSQQIAFPGWRVAGGGGGRQGACCPGNAESDPGPGRESRGLGGRGLPGSPGAGPTTCAHRPGSRCRPPTPLLAAAVAGEAAPSRARRACSP